ncbi:MULTISPECIES: hypothetical protein [unclassified Streptomyces]|uniref:hypothetical protein n=1 Tax=unclassified Streptomyces TaxID=2593676 RepID=UPI0006F4D9FC|nr:MULTISPECIES: hypothetical protein [unclassified Streptomyces]KQX50799.1 hypothetical protein ASD33_12240 [Streptomyces sp. Root1304]KRA84964.1 hypothetical protein ASE09_12245 [Streptomyces sp. Root66D1]
MPDPRPDGDHSGAEAEARDQEQVKEADRRGGPGHTVLLALALAVPVTKVAYTVGGGEAVRDVFVGMELANWPDVLIGMMITDPLLGSVLAVVISRVVFALFAARGAVPLGGGFVGAARRAALTIVNPVAVGVIDACLFGPWWGLGTGLAAYALRQGVVVEYRTGRRRSHHHRSRPGADSAYRPPAWLRRAAGVEQWVALGLTVVVLPFLAFASALDGRAWTSIVECQVTDGTRTTSDRLIELGRKGNGVVGWNLATDEVSNGLGCVGVESLYVREPWWRG